jgi:glyoxylase-like metal-dependent hydrolase (beta-lactamase superfamily II)
VAQSRALIRPGLEVTQSVTLDWLDTGACRAWEHHLIRGGAKRRLRCHALVGLIRHPIAGTILWDTGYAPRIMTATARFPFMLQRLATPFDFGDAGSAVQLLEANGIAADEVRTVILSHFHVDHVAGLRDFPQARIVVSGAGIRDATSRRGVNAVARGFNPLLLPRDLHRRAIRVERLVGPPIAGLGPTYDLFGDESIRLVELPGHARGQFGAMLATEDGPELLVADACWHSRSIRERRAPHPITNLFVDRPADVQRTIDDLASFAALHPRVRIVPTHCPETYERQFGRSAYMD